MVGDDRALQLVDRRVEKPALREQNPLGRLDHRRKAGGSLPTSSSTRLIPLAAMTPNSAR